VTAKGNKRTNPKIYLLLIYR